MQATATQHRRPGPINEPSLRARPADDVTHLELSVVMPVYNEEAIIDSTLRSWIEALTELGVDFEIAVWNDGSRDGTAAALEGLAADPRVVVVDKQNEGHGPTILRGYRRACGRAAWVFQVDSDDEVPASAFAPLWHRRADADAVLGYRVGRDQPLDRRAISRVARLTARAAYGSRFRDVNCPYRLIRAEVLSPILDRIPPDTFAPNVVISGALARSGARVVEVPVPHSPRTTGEVSIVGLGALKAAARSFLQSVRLARRFRR